VRHRVYGKKLGRNKNQRTALFRNLVRSLILSGQIETTEAKAKAIKGTVDKIINQAKSPATRNLISQYLVEKAVAEKLVKELVPQLKSRNSGYTSIIKLSKRLGDDATLVKMSLLLEASTAPKVSKVEAATVSEKPATTKIAKPKTTKKAVKK
jgi:large subunit ribosomal protein L17